MNKPQYDIDEAFVQRYREGNLSEDEQAWLQENPFEAEALEGMAENPQWQRDISLLQQQLQEHTAKRTTLWVTYGRYAAAVALLISAGWLVFRVMPTEELSEPESNEQLSYEVQSPLDTSLENLNAPLALSIPDKVTSQKATSPVSNPALSEVTEEIKPVPVSQPQTEATRLSEPAAAPALANESMQADQELAETIIEETEAVEEKAFLSKGMRPQADQARFINPPENFGHQIAGSVYSAEDQQPLPGVNVIVKGSVVGTITDMNGQFQITVPDSTNELVFSFIGFQQEEVALNQQDSLTVQLEQNEQALSEVVVTTGGYRRSDGATTSAHPVPSYDRFREYIRNNLRYPEEARNQEIEGVVRVKFTVEADGELTDFEIKKSLGYGCDEEAIRLIKEGLSWQPALQKGEPQLDQVTVRVRFKQ